MASIIALGCVHAGGQQTALPQTATVNSPDTNPIIAPAPPDCSLWATTPGEGLRQGALQFEGTLGAGWGIRDGGAYTHNLALSELRVGRVVSRVFGPGRWYQGNFEVLGEFFVGSQFHPSPRYLVGIAPVLRYEWATGSRWSPFIDLSAGITITDIGHPDLGANFEFDLQGGPGVKYYFRDDAAFILQYRYLHFSNADLYPHNHGINVNVVLLGVSWAF
jgi:hypothetical protein